MEPMYQAQSRIGSLYDSVRYQYCYEFVNIVTKTCIHYLFLNYNISDAREIFIFGEKSRDFT